MLVYTIQTTILISFSRNFVINYSKRSLGLMKQISLTSALSHSLVNLILRYENKPRATRLSAELPSLILDYSTVQMLMNTWTFISCLQVLQVLQVKLVVFSSNSKCRLYSILYINSLDQDQVPQNAGPSLEPKLFGALIYFGKAITWYKEKNCYIITAIETLTKWATLY